GWLERWRQQPVVSGQAIRACRGNDSGLKTIAMGIAARHERSPRRCAHRLGVELFEPGAGCGELVEVRRLNVRAVEPDVLPPQVVRQDVDNVRAWSALPGRWRERPPTATGQNGEREREGPSRCMHGVISF